MKKYGDSEGQLCLELSESDPEPDTDSIFRHLTRRESGVTAASVPSRLTHLVTDTEYLLRLPWKFSDPVESVS